MVGNTVGGSDVVGEPARPSAPWEAGPAQGLVQGHGARVGLLCGLLLFSQDMQHSGQLRVQGGGVDLVLWFSRLLCEAMSIATLQRRKRAEGNLFGRDRTGFEQGLAGP